LLNNYVARSPTHSQIYTSYSIYFHLVWIPINVMFRTLTCRTVRTNARSKMRQYNIMNNIYLFSWVLFSGQQYVYGQETINTTQLCPYHTKSRNTTNVTRESFVRCWGELWCNTALDHADVKVMPCSMCYRQMSCLFCSSKYESALGDQET